MQAGQRIPPFRDEQRWGGALDGIFSSGADIHESGQLISVNELPTRAWDMLLVLEPVSNLHVDSLLFAEFTIIVGVGSTTAKFLRILTEDRPVNDKTGVIETLVMPASSFIVTVAMTLNAAPGQPFPVKARCGVFAAPRGMPFLATLESAEMVYDQ